MGILLYIIGLLLSTLVGYLFLRLVLNNNKPVFYFLEYIIYSFLVGIFIQTFVLFVTSWLLIPISLLSILLTNFILLIILFALNFYLKIELDFIKFSNIKNSFFDLHIAYKILISVGLIWILIKLLFGFVSILNTPTYQDDSFGNWNMRAKVFYEKQILVTDNKDIDYLGRGYIQYPLTPSMYKTYLMNFNGAWNEGLVNLPSFIYYFLGIILLFFLIYKETNNLLLSSVGMYLISSVPLYYIHGTNPYSDIMVGLYFLLGTYFTYLFFEKKVSIFAMIFFVGIMGYIKSEGLIIFITALFLSIFISSFLNKNLFKKDYLVMLIKIIFGVVLINLPFIVFKLIYGLGFGNGDASISSTGLSFHSEIFYPLYQALFHTGAYNLLFFFFVITLLIWAFGVKKYKDNRSLFLHSFIIAFLLIIFIYLTTFTYAYVIDQTGINRSMMQITLLQVFVLILLINDIKNVKKI